MVFCLLKNTVCCVMPQCNDIHYFNKCLNISGISKQVYKQFFQKPAILRYTFPDRHVFPFIHFKIWFVRIQLNKMLEAFLFPERHCSKQYREKFIV
jgi:hypothetical protein